MKALHATEIESDLTIMETYHHLSRRLTLTVFVLYCCLTSGFTTPRPSFISGSVQPVSVSSSQSCECANCGTSMCRVACKHDCNQCCRCCIYFEIRVGRQQPLQPQQQLDVLAASAADGENETKLNISPDADNVIQEQTGTSMRTPSTLHHMRRMRRQLHNGDVDGVFRLQLNESPKPDIEGEFTSAVARRTAKQHVVSTSSAQNRRQPYLQALETAWLHTRRTHRSETKRTGLLPNEPSDTRKPRSYDRSLLMPSETWRDLNAANSSIENQLVKWVSPEEWCATTSGNAGQKGEQQQAEVGAICRDRRIIHLLGKRRRRRR